MARPPGRARPDGHAWTARADGTRLAAPRPAAGAPRGPRAGSPPESAV